ncbi:MAG: xanthine dehydrogenase family protein subunit M [Candidatus Aminicenantes bacterium]|nr:MAG: xanthine dehydrogenase family protein subunit M [Candidatus Aminicenantes bacterium]
MRGFDYFKPRSLEEALRLKETTPDARFIAGGTDLLIKIKDKELRPSALISLRSVKQLEGVEVNKFTRIGALTTISDIIQNPVLCESYPVLVEASKRVGSIQVRNVASIGGNLCNCSPAADTALPLLIYNAKVRLQSIQGSREMPLSEFFKGPGESCLKSEETLTDILLGPTTVNRKAIFLKIGRVKMDLAIASVALMLEMEGERCQKARVAVGSAAPVPLRLSKVEELLEGETVSKELAGEAQKVASEVVAPISDIRASEGYRRHIVGVLVRHALENMLGWSRA